MRCLLCSYLVKEAEHCVDVSSKGGHNFYTNYVIIRYFCGHPASGKNIDNVTKTRVIEHTAQEIVFNHMVDVEFCPLLDE